MRAAAVLAVACVACAAGAALGDFSEDTAPLEYFEEDFVEVQQPETVLLVDERTDGSLRVTGMMQSFRLEGDFEGPNQVLDRPRASFLDLTWSSWVDERLEVFDLLQALLAPRPRCPHMQPEAGSFDTSMVSYLASSRFGPAILTTYAQSFLEEEEEEDDFDYAMVNLPEAEMVGKSYEDASLLEGLSVDADRAFEREEQRLLSQQQPELGFFGANLRTPQDTGMYLSDLDGDSESLQPSIKLQPPTKFATFDRMRLERTQALKDGAAPMLQHSSGLVLFLLLCAGCVYVWASLIRSCCRMSSEVRERQSQEAAAAQKLAQQELLVPLVAEGAKPYPGVEVAAGQAPHGTYYAPQAAGYTTVAVPLMGA